MKVAPTLYAATAPWRIPAYLEAWAGDSALLAFQNQNQKNNHPPKNAQAMERLRGGASEQLRKKAVALSVEEDLQLAPWALTANFQAFKHGRCQLALSGPGDPSGRGEVLH